MSWKHYCAGWRTCLKIINDLLEKGVALDLALNSCSSALEAMDSSIEVVGQDCSKPLAYKVDGQAYKLGDVFGYEPISEAEFLEISGGFESERS
jgi:hypothetical protein